MSGNSDPAAVLKEKIPSLKMETEASWKHRTTLGAGLAPFLLVHPESVHELQEVCRVLHGIAKVRVLGAGTNFVGSDTPMPDTVFVRLDSPAFTKIAFVGGRLVECGAGALLANLARESVKWKLGGISGLSGIPGTVGGAVRMNAGALGVETGKQIRLAEGVDSNTGALFIRDFSGHEKWPYRTSLIPENIILTGTVFELKSADPRKEEKLLAGERARRAAVTPHGRSAGSVFRNPGQLKAGILLEKAGCKGLERGAWKVSPMHANWIVSERSGQPLSEKDFTELAAILHERVSRTFATSLKTELVFANKESKEKVENANGNPLNILVLKGGVSSEREISLISGAAVAAALREAGHTVEEYDIQKLEVTEAMRKADVVYPVLHGGFGEDGRLQKMLEDAGIKFVGCPSQACIDAMDKVVSKQIMDRAGIRNAPSEVVTTADAAVIDKFGFPVIVKPPCEGSTFGLTLVETPDQWRGAIELALKHDKVALVEKYIKGTEATVSVLDGKALPLVEIRYPGKLYDYDAKYTHAQGETLYLCPPQGISAAAQKEAAELAVKFYHAVGARDMLRVDVIIDAQDQVWVLEGNTLPGCTPSSLFPKAAAVAGIPFPQMCSILANAAANR